jgi:hypothetical protein
LICDSDKGCTLSIFNCSYPLEKSQLETKAFRERVERELMQCFRMCLKKSEGAALRAAVRAMFISGVPASTPSHLIIDAVKSCFNSPEADGIILLSTDSNGGISVLVPDAIKDVPAQTIAFHLGTVRFLSLCFLK